MLHHGSQRDGQDGDDGRHNQAPVGVFEHGDGGIFHLEREADPGSLFHAGEVAQAEAGRDQIGTQHTQQDGDDSDHTLSPDVDDNDDGDGQQGNPPVAGAVVDGRAGQRKADRDDDGARHDGREETHDLRGTEGGEQTGQHKVHQAGAEYADAGIRKGLLQRKTACLTNLHNGRITTQEGKGGAQKGRHFQFGTHVENQGTQTCEQQGGRHGKAGDDRHQNGGPEHGEHVLEAQGEHFTAPQGSGVVNSLHFFGHIADYLLILFPTR